jgi:hypothetical protein
MDLRPWAYANWHLNASTGNVVADSTPNLRNGIAQNMEDGDWQVGKLNNCLVFDGINEVVNFGKIASFERTDSFSVELWFKSTANGGIILCAKMNLAVPLRGWSISLDSGKISVWLINTYPTNYINVVTNSATSCNGIWHHLVVTYDGLSSANGVLIYIDNILQTTTIVTNTLNATIVNNDDFTLAAKQTLFFFTGSIDEVCIYTKKLSVAEIAWRWDGGIGREILTDNIFPPNIPNTPSPVNHFGNSPITQQLGWLGGDPDPGDIVTYDVYFDIVNPPVTKVATDNPTTTYNPGTLGYGITYFWKIVARDFGGLTTNGPVWDFTTHMNVTPNVPSLPIPNNHELLCPHNQNISWTGGDPDPGDTVTYDVYYGTSNPPPKIATDHPFENYTLPANKFALTKYYWKIVARDMYAFTTAGPIWDFTTRNEQPNLPNTPIPINGSTGNPISIDLSWSCSDNNASDTLQYDIYFGKTSTPPVVKVNNSSTTYLITGLDYDETYYWRILAKDNHGATTLGPVWSFTAKSEFAIAYPTFEPRETVRTALTTSWDINDDGTSENIMNIMDSNHNTLKIPIYLTEETKSGVLPPLPFIELGLLNVNSAPQDIAASTRKNEAYIDINIYYTTMDNVDPVDLGKKICDKISGYIRNYQSTTTGIHFMNITNTSKVFIEHYGKQVVFHRNMELYCLFYDRP